MPGPYKPGPGTYTGIPPKPTVEPEDNEPQGPSNEVPNFGDPGLPRKKQKKRNY